MTERTKERAETVDYPTTAVPVASDPDAWTEVPERIAAAIAQHPTRRYVSLWWLKSALSGPEFSDQAVEVAADQGLIAVETRHSLNPMGVRVARLTGPEHLLADWGLALDEDGYEDTGRMAEVHPFDPAHGEDACLYRMAEGYVCGSAEDAAIHRVVVR